MRWHRFAASLALLFFASVEARAADVTIGVASSALKVRPKDTPTLAPGASLKAARNEFEAFQIVLRGGASATTGVTAAISASLAGPGGAKIPDANVTLYAERYYDVGVASNDEGAAGLWPDPLVPDVDTYVGEKRNAFPFDVPSGETRAIWVDVLVPTDQAPGDYSGEIRLAAGAAELGRVKVALHVGNFTLPSTATLQSAFGMSYDAAARVHCGGSYPFCATEDAANVIRARYLRAGLEHRFTLSPADFQPPFDADRPAFETHVLPLVDGTGSTRLPGAKLTTIQLDDSSSSAGRWVTYAKSKTFFDRLFFYPVDEPNDNASMWSQFVTESDALHAVDPAAQIIITSSIQAAQAHSAADKVDIFVTVLDEMDGRPNYSPYPGDQRAKYDAWLAAKAGRKLWMYQSCDQHGCGACGEASPGVEFTGWPQRVIDSSGVQDRAFPWIAFKERVTGELYFAVDHQLATAWDANGQCAFSGSGDGTIFYPGKPSIIGGSTDIPVESIRMKEIREGMEDFEYLTLVAAKDSAKAHAIADALFPTAYECAKTPAELEAARDQLFALLDTATPGGPGADGGVDGTGTGTGADGGAANGADGGGSSDGCSCTAAERGAGAPWALAFAAAVIAAATRRRRR